MKNFLRVILILSILSSQSGAQVNETTPVGQDRGGAPAMNKLNGETKVALPLEPGKILPFYSLTATTKHSSLKCQGMVALTLTGKPDIKPVAVEFTCSNSNKDLECETRSVGKLRTEEIPSSILKTMSLPGMALDFYLSEERVNSLKNAKKVADGWVTGHKSRRFKINEAMTEMTIEKSPSRYILQTIDNMLFVTESKMDQVGKKPLSGSMKVSYQKKGEAYYPKTINGDIKIDNLQLTFAMKLNECTSN